MQKCTISLGAHCSCPECQEFREVVRVLGVDDGMTTEKAEQIMRDEGYDDAKIKKYLEIFDDIGFI